MCRIRLYSCMCIHRLPSISAFIFRYAYFSYKCIYSPLGPPGWGGYDLNLASLHLSISLILHVASLQPCNSLQSGKFTSLRPFNHFNLVSLQYCQREGVSPERDIWFPLRVCLLVPVGHGGCWLVVAAVAIGVILCQYHLGDPKIDEHWLNPQDTCSKHPRACFFWGRRSAAGSCDTDAQGLGTLKPTNNVNSK